MTKKYNTIIFDQGGVLIDLHVERCISAFRKLMGADNMARVLGFDDRRHQEENTNTQKEISEDIYKRREDSSNTDKCKEPNGIIAVSVAGSRLMKDYERGNITTTMFINSVLAHCYKPVKSDDVHAAWFAMLGELPLARLEYAKQLRKNGYRVYMLSNTNDMHWEFVRKNYPIEECFDRMFLSHEMHLAKPGQEMFEQVVRTIHTLSRTDGKGEYEPHRTIFIDDLALNREAAERFAGWHTCESIDMLKKIMNQFIKQKIIIYYD